MKCQRCGQENLSKAQFCMRCGEKLGRRCPNCGMECPEEAVFCMGCGTRLEKVPHDIPSEKIYTGENRLITSLFVDISGSTRLSIEQPREYGFRLMHEFFDRVEEIINTYGGVFRGPRGDGLLALFGTPALHEDDAERAIRAAIEIRNLMQKKDLPVHIGVNTSLVTVSSIQIDRDWGEGIILADRLCKKAKSGQILVGEGTYRITRRAFVFETLSQLNLEGFPQSVSAYAVQRPRIHPEKVRGLEGLRADLIGRDEELAQLKKCVDDLLSGKGQIVSIIGEAGVGKSRLSMEIKQYLAGKNIRWLEGKCDSVRESIGYSIFIDILRSYLGLSDEDTPEDMAEKVANVIQSLFPQKWQKVVPHIGHLLSVKFSDEWDERISYSPLESTTYQLKNQISLSLRDFFISLSNEKPLVLILEDLNFADDASLDIVSLLMDEIPNTSLMLLCIYRPDREHRSWHIGMQASAKHPDRYKEIRLQDLPPEKSRQLLDSLLQIEGFPKRIKSNILSKAGGNPLFIEEIIRSLIDSGIIYKEGEKWMARAEVEEIVVPNTIHSILMARIDRLSDDVRKVLKCASVIGTVFRQKLLEYSLQQPDMDRYLWQLEERELIYEERPIPEPEYSFRHMLTQEVLYGNMLTDERRALHQKVGNGIEQLYQARLEEFYEELAWHYIQSDSFPKAIEYSVKAGKKAQAMNAYQQAANHYENALEFIQNHPLDTPQQRVLEIAAREGSGDVFFTKGLHREAELQLKNALDLAYGLQGTLQDMHRIAILNCKLADLSHWQGNFDRAIKLAQSGLTALKEHVSSEAASLLEVLSRSYRAKMDTKSAQLYASIIERIIRRIPYFDAIYKVYYELAWLRIQDRDFHTAAEWLREMEQVCLEHNNELGLARCYHGMGDMFRRAKDFRKATQWLEKSLGYCEQVGDAHLLMETYFELADLMIRLDEDSEKIEAHIQRGMEIAERMAGTSLLASAPDMCRSLGDAYLQKNIEKAILYYRRAIEFGPPVPHLSYLICRLEQFYMQTGQHQAFFEFCRRTKEQEAFQSFSSLRYWHLQEGSPSPLYSRLVCQDSFDGPSIHPEWQWIDPQEKSSYRLGPPGILELRTPTGNDLYLPGSEGPRLLREICGDFAAEVKLVDITDSECQIGGILLWLSESIFLSFGKRSGRKTESNELHLGDQHGIISRGWLPGSEFILRIERRGDSVSSLCSSDGENWKSCGKTIFPAESPVWVGLYVGCPAVVPEGVSASVLRFKDFKLFQAG